MVLTNPGTPFDQDGWADALTDIRKLDLRTSGGSNDMNNASKGVDQSVSEDGFPLISNYLSEFTNNPAAITQIKQNLQLTPGLCHVSLTTNYTYVSNSDTIIFDTKVDDTTNSYNTTTGVFTAPVTGVYTIAVHILNNFANNPANVRWAPRCYYQLKKNGVFAKFAGYYLDMTYGSAATSSDLEVAIPLNCSMRLAQGDRLTITNASAYELISSLYGFMEGNDNSFFSVTWVSQ